MCRPGVLTALLLTFELVSRVKLQGRLMRVLVGMAMTWAVISQEYIGVQLPLLHQHSIYRKIRHGRQHAKYFDIVMLGSFLLLSLFTMCMGGLNNTLNHYCLYKIQQYSMLRWHYVILIIVYTAHFPQQQIYNLYDALKQSESLFYGVQMSSATFFTSSLLSLSPFLSLSTMCSKAKCKDL